MALVFLASGVGEGGMFEGFFQGSIFRVGCVKMTEGNNRRDEPSTVCQSDVSACNRTTHIPLMAVDKLTAFHLVDSIGYTAKIRIESVTTLQKK